MSSVGLTPEPRRTRQAVYDYTLVTIGVAAVLVAIYLMWTGRPLTGAAVAAVPLAMSGLTYWFESLG